MYVEQDYPHSKHPLPVAAVPLLSRMIVASAIAAKLVLAHASRLVLTDNWSVDSVWLL